MGLRTGAEYIAGLKDGREVWMNGQRVPDVTTDPLIRPAIEATARLYDMQHDPAKADLFVAETPHFPGKIGRTFQAPRTLDELVARREAIRLWMSQSCGFLGRSPDFLNTMLTAMREKSDFFAQQSPERQHAVEEYYRHVATNDLFLTHALHEPQVDRSKRRSEQPDGGTALKVIGETKEGLIVSGAKTVATAAAYADDVLMWPNVPNWGPNDEPYALCCSIPIASPGLKVLCRQSFTRPTAKEDYPISSQFDEMDSVLTFDNVLVPWDRVFLHGDPKLVSQMYSATRIRNLTAHQTGVRLLVKLEFLYALLLRISKAIGVEGTPSVEFSLGEAASYVEIVRSAVMASEYQAKVDPATGVLYPNFEALNLTRLFGPRLYPEFIAKIRRLAASGLMQVPASISDFDSPIGPEMDIFYRGATITAREKTRLMRLAWDVCGSELGARHSLYEMFYTGDPDQNFRNLQRDYAHKAELLGNFDKFFETLNPSASDTVPSAASAAA